MDNHVGAPEVQDILSEGAGRYAWGLQEKMKGLMPMNWMLGSNYGGWSFNIMEYLNMLNPVTANGISLETIKIRPFFMLSGDDTTLLQPGAVGSEYARSNRDRLLADVIPALSLAVGRNHTDYFEDRNIDMNQNFKNDWPSERKSGENDLRWRHSDLKDVSYTYTCPLYDNLVQLMR